MSVSFPKEQVLGQEETSCSRGGLNSVLGKVDSVKGCQPLEQAVEGGDGVTNSWSCLNLCGCGTSGYVLSGHFGSAGLMVRLLP